MTNSIRTLLTDLIDYAGLFPPAKLPMQASAETYHRCLISEHSWMLGRFISPASRLDELSACAGVLMPGTLGTSGYREHALRTGGEPWHISALIDVPTGEDISAAFDRALALIDAFNARHAHERHGLAEVDMVEMKVSDPREIDRVLDRCPEGLYPFFEFPSDADVRGYIAALSGSPAGAKIRTGGITPEAFPISTRLADFLHACASADVPFKATAGLHHPVRGVHRLTYEQNSPSHVMHGFINLFLAAALVRGKDIPPEVTRSILHDEDPFSFRFSHQVAGWKDWLIETALIASARETFSLSFGSCSFDEPVEDLTRLGWL